MLECRLEIRRNRRHVEHAEGETQAQRSDHVIGKTEYVGIRKDAHIGLARDVRVNSRNQLYIGAEVPDGGFPVEPEV